MNPYYAAVARRASHQCEYCHAPEAVFNFPFEVEHIVPASRQGDDETDNLALACRACNVRKADHLTGTDETTGIEHRLFNPRTDRWHDHFQLDTNSGLIVGETAVGRATIVRLEMNHSLQVEARRLWIRLRLMS